MSSPPTQCDSDLLQRSLNDALNEAQEEWLVQHLEHCADCRHHLEGLAGASVDWSRIEAALKDESSKQLAGDSNSPTLLSDVGIIAPDDFAVDFLQPSTDSESIGQLANIQIRSVIGYGGNGIVLKGLQQELNRLVAVKVMAPHLATSAPARQRFAREAQATAAIVHPNVMPILSVNSSGQLPFLVMPYVDCESLQQRLDRGGSLPVVDMLRIGVQVARGLATAHAQGLVHRDVKPANILLERGVDRVMLTDFGLARAVDDASLTRTGLIAGTPQYMSPEQARGDGIDTRSDLFSLGSVLYAMGAGRPPFRAETSYGILRRVTDEQHRSLTQLNPDVPDWLAAITDRLLAKDVDDRFESADQVAGLLEDSLAHVQQPNAIPLPLAVKLLVKRNHSRAWLMLCGVLIVALIAAVVSYNAESQNSNADSRNPNSVDSPETDVQGNVTEEPIRSDQQLSSGLVTEESERNTAWDDVIARQLQELDNAVDDLANQTDSEGW